MYTREEIRDMAEDLVDKCVGGLERLIDALAALSQPSDSLAEAFAELASEVKEEAYATVKRQPTRHPIRTEKYKNMNRGYRYCFRPVYLARGRC